VGPRYPRPKNPKALGKNGSDEQIFGVIEQTSGDQSDYRDTSLKVIWDTFPENALEAQLRGKDDE
jgi:hypothetical protein